MIMQSLDSNLEVGFFLHIPFLPPENFFTKYRIAAFPILRGLLRFTKVQTNIHDKTYIFFVRSDFKHIEIALNFWNW